MKRLGNLLLVAFALVAIAGLVGCASTPKEVNQDLVGTWKNDDGTIIVFRNDGTGTGPVAGLTGTSNIEWKSTATQITTKIHTTGFARMTSPMQPQITYDYVLDGDTLKLNGVEYKKVQ